MRMELAAEIVSAYVRKNAVQAADLPALIESVHAAIGGLDQPVPAVVEKLVPAVPLRKSVTDDYLVCLEDGKKFKSLKRHLMTHYSLTPDDYRQKWGLPADYPMVAPNYAAARSQLAKSMGLGRKPKVPEPVVEPAKPKRGRKPKVTASA